MANLIGTGRRMSNTGDPCMVYNSDGSLSMGGSKYSYTASSTAFTPGATPTDIFTISGSATALVKVTCLAWSATQTTAGINAWMLLRRSVANTSGTSAPVTAVPSDKNNPAASATVLQYTANPTVSGLIGSVWSGHVNAPSAGTAGVSGYIGNVVEFTENFGQTMVLRGINDVLSLNFGGAALPAGLSVLVTIDWSEESLELNY